MALADKDWEVEDQQPSWKVAQRDRAAAKANGAGGTKGQSTTATLALQVEMPPTLEQMVEAILASQSTLTAQVTVLAEQVQSLGAVITQARETLDSQMADGMSKNHKDMQTRIAALEKAITAPRVITLERDKDGLAKSATSRIGKA